MKAIISALENPEKHKSDSSVETNFVKLKAPINIIYGIIAILMVFIIANYYNFKDQTNTIYTLTRQRDSLVDINEQLTQTLSDSIPRTIRVVMNRDGVKSIFGGKVLIESTQYTLKFKGIKRLSKDLSGTTSENETELKPGERFYFVTNDKTIWGVNILADYPTIILEIFKV